MLLIKSFLVFILTFLNKHTTEQTCNLVINVPNIKNNKGNLQVKIYNNNQSFPKADEQYKEAVFKISNNPGPYLIKDLPKAVYAIAILHDENSDKKCNTNFNTRILVGTTQFMRIESYIAASAEYTSWIDQPRA